MARRRGGRGELFHAQVLCRLRAIFDAWPHGLRMLRWLSCYFSCCIFFRKLREFLSWSSFFCFRSSNGETRCRWFRATDTVPGTLVQVFLADWLARTCYRMEPASEQDQMQCILEEQFLPGMAISIAAIALCFLAASMKFPCHVSKLLKLIVSLPDLSEAGPGSWVRMIRDKNLSEEPQVFLGVWLQVKHAFSACIPPVQDPNLNLRCVLRLYLTRSYQSGYEIWEAS